MAAPTIRAVGAEAEGIAAISPGLPTGTVAGDLLLMFLETRGGQAITVSGWTQLPIQSPKESGATSPHTRLTIFYKIAAGGDATTTSDSGDHQQGIIVGITAGTFDATTPFNGAGGGATAATDTAVTIPGGTTTLDDCLIFAAVSAGELVNTGSWANASLVSITEQFEILANIGTVGSAAGAAGVKTTAGTYDATTATLSATSVQARISFAVAPVASGSPPANTVAPAVTGNTWVDQVLTDTDGTWTGTPTPTITKQWQREVSVGSGTYADIAGATADTHTNVDADRTLRKRIKEHGSNASGEVDAFSAAVGPIGTATALLGLLEMQADLVGSWLAPPPEIQGGQRPHIGIGIRIGV